MRPCGYSTSGASEMIFMNRLSLQFPAHRTEDAGARGSPSAFSTTAAFSSKRMYDPSERRRSLRRER